METRICGICKRELPKTLEFFASRKGVRKIRFQGNCRDCQKQYRKDHYYNNKEKYLKKASKYRKDFYIWFHDIKKKLKCEECNENRYWVLDFHHLDPTEKEESLTVLVQRSSKENVLKEIAKCKVLCSNCHRDFHYKERLDKGT